MIEFKGMYYSKVGNRPQSVLVQFDGVLLHVWHMANPFHRLLTSDMFRLPSIIGKRRHYIKLPGGDRIETDNTDALITLRSRHQSQVKNPAADRDIRAVAIVMLCCSVLLLGLYAVKAWF